MESRETQLREEVISKEDISRLMVELRRCQGLLQEGAGQVSQILKLVVIITVTVS